MSIDDNLEEIENQYPKPPIRERLTPYIAAGMLTGGLLWSMGETYDLYKQKANETVRVIANLDEYLIKQR